MDRRHFLRGTAGVGTAMAFMSGLGAIITACAQMPGFGQSTKLEMWAFASNRITWEKALIEQFVKSKGGKIESITVTSIPADQLDDKLQAALLAGTGIPDMVDHHLYLWTRFMNDEKLLSHFVTLNDRIGSEKENLVTSSALDPWTWKGKYYGLCNELNSVLFYTRFDLFRQAGITEPVANWDVDFIEKGKQLASKTGAKMIALSGTSFGDLYLMSYQRGGSFFDADGSFVGDQDIVVKTLEFMQDLVYKHEVAMIAPAETPAYYGAMAAGKFACQMGAPWYQGFMKDNVKQLSGKWHIQDMPSWSDGKGYVSVTYGGTGMGIMSSASNIDLAWEFIKYANLTVDGIIQAFTLENLYPTYKPALSDSRLKKPDPYFDNQTPGDKIAAVVDKMAPYHTSPYFSAIVAESTSAMNRLVIQPVMQNKKKPKDAFKDLAAEARKIMGK